MNVTEYTYILNKPNAVNNYQVIALEQLLENFPYFQSAISLHLKGLYAQDSFKYNQALKKAAAHSTDRSVLFEFITSEKFVSIQNKIFEDLTAKTLSIEVVDSKILNVSPILETNTLEKSIVDSINIANEIIPIANDELNKIENLEQNLEIGKPLQFTNSETHSFNEWLQIAKLKPIVREDTINKNELNNSNLASKLPTIDKFIEANPKIKPVEKEAEFQVIAIKTEDSSYLMTETLAKVYLEQKKYSKAIQAYQILILKYPEKSSFFADRISDVKKLQQNINN